MMYSVPRRLPANMCCNSLPKTNYFKILLTRGAVNHARKMVKIETTFNRHSISQPLLSSVTISFILSPSKYLYMKIKFKNSHLHVKQIARPRIFQYSTNQPLLYRQLYFYCVFIENSVQFIPHNKTFINKKTLNILFHDRIKLLKIYSVQMF